ncbi:hypothetical protein C8F01DRAFT_1171127 [Mycena amicta]|nr:hypothetical protein C8F01DRAFT_1171127 [Mycena amicta]
MVRVPLLRPGTPPSPSTPSTTPRLPTVVPAVLSRISSGQPSRETQHPSRCRHGHFGWVVNSRHASRLGAATPSDARLVRNRLPSPADICRGVTVHSTIATTTALPAHTSSRLAPSCLPRRRLQRLSIHRLARRPRRRIAVLLHESENIPCLRDSSVGDGGLQNVVRAFPELQLGSFECSRRWTGAIGISYDSDSYDT